MRPELIDERVEPAGFEGWADVEIMGHRQRTGELTNVLVGDRVFVQVREPAFTKSLPGELENVAERVEIYSPTAIFAIVPLPGKHEAVESLEARAGIPF